MDLKESDILGSDISSHWYYRAKLAAMSRLLGEYKPMTILDVGAGSGFFSRHLLASTEAVEAWCVDISYASEWDGIEAGKPVHYRRSIDAINTDLVLLMDVLEHVDNDVGLLREYAAKVPSGSQIFISVPAFQFLWSGHDEFLEHKRRYDLAGLEQTVLDSGLKLKRSSYYFGLVFPIAAAIRLAQNLARGRGRAQSQLTRHHPIVNTFLKSLCMAELPILKANRLAGLSVFCLAEKP